MNLHLKSFAIALLLIILCSCNSHQNKGGNNLSFDSVKEYFKDTSLMVFDRDSIFLDKHYKKSLVSLDSGLRANWLDDHSPLSIFKPYYDADFLNIVKDDSIKQVTLVAETDAYYAILLITTNQNLDLIDLIEISGGVWGGVTFDEEIDKVVWEPKKITKIPDDENKLKIIDIKVTSDDYERRNLRYDTAISYYKIQDNGNIVKVDD